MNTQIFFSEKQKFTQWWIWLLFIALNAFFVFAVYRQVIKGVPLGDNPLSNAALLIICVLFLIFTLFFYLLRLDTEIKEDGIYVRFFPLGIKFKHIPWNTIKSIEIREYKPLLEYGGWGIRYGNGKALNVSGKIGLQIMFKEKGKLLIGTQKPDELEEVIKKFVK